MPLERFRDYPEWDRYTLTHTEPVIDRTGEIQRVIDEKGRLSDEEKKSIPPLALDAYMNSLYRGLKRPAGIGGRLHEAEAIGHLLTCLFALEGRVRPFHDYLEWELGALSRSRGGTTCSTCSTATSTSSSAASRLTCASTGSAPSSIPGSRTCRSCAGRR